MPRSGTVVWGVQGPFFTFRVFAAVAARSGVGRLMWGCRGGGGSVVEGEDVILGVVIVGGGWRGYSRDVGA